MDGNTILFPFFSNTIIDFVTLMVLLYMKSSH